TLQAVLIRLNRSFQNFFRRVKKNESPGFPRFKGRNRFNSLVFTPTAFQVQGHHVAISKVGNLKIKMHRKLPEKHGTLFLKQICGSWYACFSCEVAPQVFPQSTPEIGVDVGLDSFAVHVQVISCGVFEGGLVKLKFIMVTFALLTLGTAAKKPAQSSETPTDKRIDAVFSRLTSPDAPGLAVLVRMNGSIVFERGYGVRDLRSKAKIDAGTNFRLASCTKQFTAMAIMLLIHDGKLRYDETLTEIFPDFPRYGKTIAVRNLLNHTSRLPAYEDLMDAAEK